jgi:tetratricopeptide (TPR) repeat protein
MVDHFELIAQGLEKHEARRYQEALPYFEEALALAPDCPSGTYNLANTLHMLGPPAGSALSTDPTFPKGSFVCGLRRYVSIAGR